MRMSIVLLFALGAAAGIIANALTGAKAHQRQFNNVSAGIIGALLGGCVLPHLLGGRNLGRHGIDVAALLLGGFEAAILLTLLAVLRKRFSR